MPKSASFEYTILADSEQNDLYREVVFISSQKFREKRTLRRPLKMMLVVGKENTNIIGGDGMKFYNLIMIIFIIVILAGCQDSPDKTPNDSADLASNPIVGTYFGIDGTEINQDLVLKFGLTSLDYNANCYIKSQFPYFHVQ